MVATVTISTHVPESRHIEVTVPQEVPVGPAEMVIVVVTGDADQPRTLGDLAASGFFGAWAGRTDVQDSVEYARLLRADAWSRER